MAFNLFNRRRIDSGSHEYQSFYCKFARFINGRLKFLQLARAGTPPTPNSLRPINILALPSLPPLRRFSRAIVTPKTLTHLLHENPNCAAAVAATAAHEEDDTTTTFVRRCCLLPLFCLLLREREEPLPYYTR